MPARPRTRAGRFGEFGDTVARILPERPAAALPPEAPCWMALSPRVGERPGRGRRARLRSTCPRTSAYLVPSIQGPRRSAGSLERWTKRAVPLSTLTCDCGDEDG